MRKLRILTLIFSLALFLSACFEDTEIKFTDTLIEFEDAVMRAPATGETFPIITLTRASGTPSYQINLIGPHLTQAEDVSFSLDAVPDRLLNATTIVAVEGVHYTLGTSPLSFPTGQSTANFTSLTIAPGFPAQAGMTALLILKLDGNDNLRPSENHRRIGIRINLN